MKNPGMGDSGSGCGGDTGGQRLPAAVQCAAGWIAGDLLRFSEAPGKKTPEPGGSGILSGDSVDLALPQLLHLPGRYPPDIPAGNADGTFAVGDHCRHVASAGFFHILDTSGGTLARVPVSLEKIFGFCKNFVCICGKMGYNSMYENL